MFTRAGYRRKVSPVVSCSSNIFFLLSQLLRNLLPIFLRPRPHLAVLVFLSFDDRSRRKLASDHPFWRLRRSSWKNQPTAGRWLMSTRWRQDCRPVTQDFWRKSNGTGEFGSWFTRLQRLSLVGALLMAGRGYLRASWVVEAELGWVTCSSELQRYHSSESCCLVEVYYAPTWDILMPRGSIYVGSCDTETGRWNWQTWTLSRNNSIYPIKLVNGQKTCHLKVEDTISSIF